MSALMQAFFGAREYAVTSDGIDDRTSSAFNGRETPRGSYGYLPGLLAISM
jgi:hypothetical protein